MPSKCARGIERDLCYLWVVPAVRTSGRLDVMNRQILITALMEAWLLHACSIKLRDRISVCRDCYLAKPILGKTKTIDLGNELKSTTGGRGWHLVGCSISFGSSHVCLSVCLSVMSAYLPLSAGAVPQCPGSGVVGGRWKWRASRERKREAGT